MILFLDFCAKHLTRDCSITIYTTAVLNAISSSTTDRTPSLSYHPCLRQMILDAVSFLLRAIALYASNRHMIYFLSVMGVAIVAVDIVRSPFSFYEQFPMVRSPSGSEYRWLVCEQKCCWYCSCKLGDSSFVQYHQHHCWTTYVCPKYPSCSPLTRPVPLSLISSTYTDVSSMSCVLCVMFSKIDAMTSVS